jgi:uncharacterized RmlC-like cupin family protein
MEEYDFQTGNQLGTVELPLDFNLEQYGMDQALAAPLERVGSPKISFSIVAYPPA